jgi:hypothetical protein
MSVIQRQQVIPFTVLSGQSLDLTTYTKFDHSKVLGVVLLPDKNIFGDRIYLEINKETVLPYNFNAGLISFRQFLNKEMRRNVYVFEEWGLGSEVRVIYKNNDKRSVNIDMVLLTVKGDLQPIKHRKKLQIVPVPFTQYPEPAGNGFEPCEIRTKTDFYFNELIGVFNDHFNYIQTAFDSWLATGIIGKIIRDFLDLLELPPANSSEEKSEKKNRSKAIQERIGIIVYIPPTNKNLIDAMKKSLSDYLDDNTPEPAISQKDLFALQESVESFILYDDNHQTLSTLELILDSQPFYPDEYPIANIVPRYRKTFNDVMYKTGIQVQDADIFIRFVHQAMKSDRPHIPTDFSMYFLYNQTVRP